MHKHKKYLFSLITVAALFTFIAISGCKKEDAADTCTNGIMDGNETDIDCGGDCNACEVKNYRVKGETFTLPSGKVVVYSYFYLPDGRVDSIAKSGDGISYQKFVYTTNRVVEFYGGYIDTYTLNSSGFASDVVHKDTSGNVLNTYTKTYDANGHLLNNNITYTYANGNLITVSGSPAYTYTYTDKPNTISYENKGRKYLGIESRNLVESVTIGTSPSTVVSYNYQFDALNRVVRIEDRGTVTSYTYY